MHVRSNRGCHDPVSIVGRLAHQFPLPLPNSVQHAFTYGILYIVMFERSSVFLFFSQPCPPYGDVDGKSDRSGNFKKVLQAFFGDSPPGGPPGLGGPPSPPSNCPAVTGACGPGKPCGEFLD